MSGKLFKSQSELVVLFFLYTLAHGGLLFILNAHYWDDWVFYDTNDDYIVDISRQTGSFFNITGYLAIFFNNIGTWASKVLTFILFFWTGLILRSLLAGHKLITREQRFIIVLLFLILPFNIARSLTITFLYTLSTFLFFLAWYFLYRQKLISIVLFFISFATNSLLVFYAIPLVDFFIQRTKRLTNKNKLNFILRHTYLIALPFVFYFIKSKYFKPYGMYEGYNEIVSAKQFVPALRETAGNAVDFLTKIESSTALASAIIFPFVYYFLNRVVNSKKKYSKNTLFFDFGKLLLLFSVIVFLLLPYIPIGKRIFFFLWLPILVIIGYKKLIDGSYEKIINGESICFVYKTQPQLTIFILGFGMLFIGMFPYMLIGLAPVFDSWSSRHQLLMPLGAAVCIAAIVYFIDNICNLKYLKILILLPIVVISIAHQIVSYIDLYFDSEKQNQIIRLIGDNDEIKSAQVVFFDDSSKKKYNAFGRDISVYEFNGLMAKAFGDQTRFGLTEFLYHALYLRGAYDTTTLKYYKAGSHIVSPTSKAVIVKIFAVDEPHSIVRLSAPKFNIEVNKLDLTQFK